MKGFQSSVTIMPALMDTTGTPATCRDVHLYHHNSWSPAEPIPYAYFRITSAHGPVAQGQLDANGRATVQNVPQGFYRISLSTHSAQATDETYIAQLKQQADQQRAQLKAALEGIITKLARVEDTKQLRYEQAGLENKAFNLIASVGEAGHRVVTHGMEGAKNTIMIGDQALIDLTDQMITIALSKAIQQAPDTEKQMIHVSEDMAHQFWWLVKDKQTWGILDYFSHHCWQTLSTAEKVIKGIEGVYYTPAMIAIILLTDGTALPGVIAADAGREIATVEEIFQGIINIAHIIDTLQTDVAHADEVAILDPALTFKPR